MSYNCKILLDSISETGKRITTMEITFPRIVLAEGKTHRMFRGWSQNVAIDFCDVGINDDENLSRNSASTRAIPLLKQIERIMNDTFIPERFPLNCSGMQPQIWIEKTDPEYTKHESRWLYKRDLLIAEALKDLEEFNWHKQLIGRPLEVFMWHTAIITATEFDNFFKLRCNENAQHEIRRIADLMYEAYHSNWKEYEIAGNLSTVQIKKLKVGEWHCPLVSEEDGQLVIDYLLPKEQELKHLSKLGLDNYVQELKKKISVARCARVSYLTHDNKRDIEKDLELFERLRTSGHWSPFEHVATPNCTTISDIVNTAVYIPKRNQWSGNFLGWKQYRKEFQDENCISFRKE